MTTDERISKDLAVVARVSRERPTPVEATLRKVGALPEAATQISAPARSTPTFAAIALLRLSRIYSLRAARAAAGATAVACTAAMIVFTCFANDFDWRTQTLLGELAWISKLWIAMVMLLVVSCVYIISLRLAVHRFQRTLLRADDGANRLVRRADHPSVLASICGTMTLLLFFGMMQVTIGGDGLESLFARGFVVPWMQLEVARWTIVFLLAGITASYVGALVVARRAPPHSNRSVVLGIVFLVATVFIGFRYDAGPHRVDWPHEMPSLWFRGCLTVTGTIGLFLIVSNIVLYIRAREERELAS